MMRSILTEVYLSHACSCHEILTAAGLLPSGWQPYFALRGGGGVAPIGGGDGGESFLRLHWVAVPKATRARRANRRRLARG
jgi:hypothetical protein